jgi:hypothetical protein
MDNNFSNILDIFKRLDETAGFEFAGEKRGQNPGEQWRGTDAGTPGTKLVGAGESIEECDTEMSPLEAKLRARWEATKEGLAEYGMTTSGTVGAAGPTNGANPQAPQQATPNPADAQKLKAGVQSLKSAGLDIDPNKLDQALTKAGSGADISNQDEKAFAAMAPQIAGIASNPQLNQQFKQLLDKNKQQQAQQQKAQGTV